MPVQRLTTLPPNHAEPGATTIAFAAEDPLNRKRLSQQLYERLEEQIVNGNLAPGTKLVEDVLAAQFGVSRSPVREAIVELERAGFADRQGLRDRRVAVPTEKLIRDTYDVFAILEIGRAYLSSLAATLEDRRYLSALLGGMEGAMERSDQQSYEALSLEFHAKLGQPCQNQRLDAILGLYRKYLRWFRALYYDYHREISQTALDAHRKIVDGYVRKDLVGLTETLQSHINDQREQVLERWRRLAISPEDAR